MSAYDLETLSLPVLKGAALRAFVTLLENPATRGMLLAALLKSGGVTKLRNLQLDRSPLFYPQGPQPPADRARLGRRTPDRPSAREIRACAGTPSDAAVFAGIADYARAYESGRTTPAKVAERFLEALAAESREERPLNAFIAVDAGELRRLAADSTRRHESGRTLGPLDGVPVAVKDEVDMLPYPTTVGTRFLGSAPATSDATTVARLRAAGALLLGKANMHEIGINPTGHNVHYGHVRNPYDRNHDSGGSSSGPAAATAAGLCPIALGADGGGSIRVPAAHCGLVGLKPTFGRISGHGAAPIAWSVAHLGPIGASTRDVALAYAIMAGPDPADANSHHQPPVTIAGWDRRDLTNVTVGVYRPWFEHAQPQIVAACDDLLVGLIDRGATLREVEIPGLDALRIAHAVTILSEMASAMSLYPDHKRSFAPATRVSLALGRTFTSDDYLRAQRVRAEAMARFVEVFDSVDVLMSPTTAAVAPAIPADGIPSGVSDLGTVTEMMRYAIPGNMLGFPAISFPAGYTTDGLPIGMQAMTSHWREELLLGISHVAEQLVERHAPQVRYALID